MYGVSDLYRLVIRGSHQIATKFEVFAGDDVVTLDVVIDGKVTVDGRAAVRRRGDLRLVDQTGTLTPAVASDLLHVYGNEIKPYRGVTIPSGGVETIPLGVFTIDEVNIDDTAAGVSITIAGSDRARRISRNRWTQPYVIPVGENIGDAVAGIVVDRYPDAVLQFDETDRTLGASVVLGETAENDPWADALKLADSIGFELYFGPNGNCVFQAVPDVTEVAPVWNYDSDQAMILSTGRRLSNEYGYNGGIARGESSGADTPVRAEVWDDDPTSPTFYLGNYGKVPAFIASEFITTEAQALDAARGLLRRKIGATEQVQFTSLVNPAHEAGDVITIVREPAKINGVFVLDRFDIPFGPAVAMPATCRERKVVA